MATRRKERPLVGDGRDGRDYRAFAEGLLDGSIRATLLVETTVPDGSRNVTFEQFDENGQRLPDVVATLGLRRLIKLEYDDPTG
jgi:hypothetical protein